MKKWVKDCDVKTCPLWPWRLGPLDHTLGIKKRKSNGKNRFGKSKSELQSSPETVEETVDKDKAG